MRGAEGAAFWFFLGGWVAALLRACALALATALCFFSRRSSVAVGESQLELPMPSSSSDRNRLYESSSSSQTPLEDGD